VFGVIAASVATLTVVGVMSNPEEVTTYGRGLAHGDEGEGETISEWEPTPMTGMGSMGGRGSTDRWGGSKQGRGSTDRWGGSQQGRGSTDRWGGSKQGRGSTDRWGGSKMGRGSTDRWGGSKQGRGSTDRWGGSKQETESCACFANSSENESTCESGNLSIRQCLSKNGACSWGPGEVNKCGVEQRWFEGRGGGETERPEPFSGSDQEKVMRMKKAMESLGGCSGLVKKAMMECFLSMSDEVRDALGEEGAGLTPEETKWIGKIGGSCYEEGLLNLGKCLKEQNGGSGNGNEE